ncbi:DUF1153 domain-containing protein [Rhodoblastus acidophilus]|uniref:DUF1153 domain-containing protein n=1 Tax=Rhodoblastus acidophilus TaxID=1074 RepID=A0A6N8DT70_RHOAC|nr:DUF1153 domain-containing protein [Rhodoblastus acidophilus]MCW2276361.1 hypothetical protein [Rhodoblastus acidophilus]MTV33016.1 DUF1153 domain-containing protein [Rhodoblastus acidophilus]
MWIDLRGNPVKDRCSDGVLKLFAQIGRFTPARKMALVAAVKNGHATLGDVLKFYRISEDEWLAWSRDANGGRDCMRVSRRSPLALDRVA